MSEAFDIAATTYDEVFTNSHIGILQRRLVYKYLEQTLPKNTALTILEINCGTGQDAIWLSNQGHNIIATDISPEMISVAKNKQPENTINTLEFRQLDINNLGQTSFEHSFDLIFSDFGGLNCLSPEQLVNFLKSAKKKLKPQGRIIGVIMPKHCLLENVYFIFKGNFKKAFRRHTINAVPANVDGTIVDTWYYNPKTIKKLSKPDYVLEQIQPIGFFIPPSYLEPFFKKRQGVLKIMEKLDRIFNRFSFLSKYSDHYVISIRIK